MTTVIVQTAGIGIIDRIGTKAERETLLDVMAGQLGIPRGEFKDNPSVIPVLVSASNRYVMLWQTCEARKRYG